jgi:hypothetical protein
MTDVITIDMFGSDPKTLVRTEDPDTSYEAANSVDTSRLEFMVYEAIAKFPNGCISDQIRSLFPKYPYSSITARYRALLDRGFIEDTGERRKGASGKNQRVMKVLSERKQMEPAKPRKREWVGLNETELQALSDGWSIMFGGYVQDFAKAIEDRLKEKNSG